MLAVILLATYNGERYLAKQLDSIFAQTYPHILLVARDDCSSDATYRILQDYQQRYSNQLIIVESHTNNQGPLRTFSDLLEYVLQRESELGLNDYCIAFCDQDDIWEKNKLRISIEYLQSLRGDRDDSAILIHSDLIVIDEQERTINPSLAEYQGIQPQRNHFAELIMHNTVTGCTALLTPALARACVPIPEQAYMHDWWCALIASLAGRIHYIEQPLVYYRQHNSNTLGARQFERRTKREILRELVQPKTDQVLKRVARQAGYIWCQSSSTYHLTWRQKIACWLVAYLLKYNNSVLRALAMKLLQFLSVHVIQR